MARLLEGKPISEIILRQLSQEVSQFKKKPVLASIMIGQNSAAESYVKSQSKMAQQLGVDYQLQRLPAAITEGELLNFIHRLNIDDTTDGIILQMPLPAHLDPQKAIAHISFEKDIEGMHPINLGRLFLGQSKIVPCTAQAVMELLKATQINLYGKDTVIVGHSDIVGKPLAMLLLRELVTVTICHIGTFDAGKLKDYISKAEILIVAVGRPELIKGEWIKEGAIVIDVGINRVEGKIVGDVEFDSAQKRASFISPVPGGVGPLTVTMLMRNLIEAIKARQR